MRASSVKDVLLPRRWWPLLALATVFLSAAPAQAHFNKKKAIWGPVAVDGHSQFPLYEQLGVGNFEQVLAWRDVASSRPARPTDPSDPAYLWPASVDEAVRETQARGMAMTLMVIGTPGWANGGAGRDRAPTRMSDLANFFRATAKRYPTVHMWMVWGEPTRHVNFELQRSQMGFPLTALQAAAPRRYARMLDASYVALKKASPKNTVIGGNTYTTGDVTTLKWIQNMLLPNGKPPRMDWYGHNPFTNREPNLGNPQSPQERMDFSDLGRLDKAVNKYLGRPRKKSIKLFLSEWTIPTAIDEEFNFYVDPPVAARWITKAFRIANRSSFIAALGWVHVFDELPATAAGLFNQDGTPKPGAQAFTDG